MLTSLGRVRCSIVCLTYNHVGFIRQALEGFVMQRTDFPFEVVIHDDASTDGTAEVIREYVEKFPDLFVPILQKENQWRKGRTLSKTFVYPKIRGEYVAFCEGDDYWTDPMKLQRQVDFLDAHRDFSVCFHPVRVVYEDGHEESFPSAHCRFHKNTLGLEEILKRNFIQTNSVMFRWRFHSDSLDLIPDRILPSDHIMNILHAQVGKIGYLPQVMAVYRRHQGGMWLLARRSPEWFLKNSGLALRFASAVSDRFGHQDFKEVGFLQEGVRLAVLRGDGHQSTAAFRFSVVRAAISRIPEVVSFDRRRRDSAMGILKASLVALTWR